MNKTKKTLHILFLLIVANEIITDSSDPSTNLRQKTTYLRIETSYIKSSIITPKHIDIEKEKKEEEELCESTQPLKGIKEECFNGNTLIYGETCCYMTIKYETNDFYKCIAVEKDLTSIKQKIEDYKKIYEGSKSIYIDCKSSFIRISLISLFLFFIF